MYKFLFLIVIVFLYACNHKPSAEQISKLKITRTAQVLFPYSDTSYNWIKVEKTNNRLKQQFINRRPADLKDVFEEYLHTDGSLPPELEQLNAAIHVLDVNGDGVDDVIYEGYSGGEPKQVTVYLNDHGKFKKVFSDKQFVRKMEFSDGKLSKLYVTDPGCCADYITFNKVYAIVYSGSQPVFKREMFTSYDQQTQLPKNYLSHPFEFVTLKDSSKLHIQPRKELKDTIYLGGEVHIGNDAARLGKSSKGRAIAKYVDNKGNIWWFVEMNPELILSGNVFYDENKNAVSGKIGWMQNEDVKPVF